MVRRYYDACSRCNAEGLDTVTQILYRVAIEKVHVDALGAEVSDGPLEAGVLAFCPVHEESLVLPLRELMPAATMTPQLVELVPMTATTRQVGSARIAPKALDASPNGHVPAVEQPQPSKPAESPKPAEPPKKKQPEKPADTLGPPQEMWQCVAETLDGGTCGAMVAANKRGFHSSNTHRKTVHMVRWVAPEGVELYRCLHQVCCKVDPEGFPMIKGDVKAINLHLRRAHGIDDRDMRARIIDGSLLLGGRPVTTVSGTGQV